MDGWKLILSEEKIKSIVKCIAEKLNEKYHDHNVVLVPILTGAMYFAVDLSRLLLMEHTIIPIDVSSYVGQKREKLTIKSVLNPDDFIGKTIIIIDELADTGHSLLKVASIIKGIAGESINVMTCVAMNKILKNPEEKVFMPDIVGVDLPNVWVVGYGLDYNGKYRNLMSVYAMPKIDPEDMTEDDKKIFD